MAKFELRKYTQVLAESSVLEEYIIPDGKNIVLSEIGGDAARSENVKVELLWGTELFFSTHGDSVQRTIKECLGDGEKKLIIKLTNDTLVSETIGGYILGDYYN